MIVVTGCSGCLGGAVARALLARGDKVRCLQRSDVPELRAMGAEVVRIDLGGDRASVADALGDATGVVHIAAKAGVWGPCSEYFAANVTATRNMLIACQKSSTTTRFVYTSTPSVVHLGGDVAGVDESAPTIKRSISPYAYTKALAERLVLDANGAALATCALRPHLIWGPHDTQLTARILARARAGKLRLVGGGKKLIDSVYIDNAVAAHLLALDGLRPDAACAGKAYFITQGQPMPQKQLIDGILAAAGLPPCEKNIAPWLAYAAGAVLEALWLLLRRRDEPMLTRFVARQLATAHWYNISAARRDLGYVPVVDVDEGLRRLGAQLRSVGAITSA